MMKRDLRPGNESLQSSGAFVVSGVIEVCDPFADDVFENWIRIFLAHLGDHPRFTEIFFLAQMLDAVVDIIDGQ